jgi:hypothetical protein
MIAMATGPATGPATGTARVIGTVRVIGTARVIETGIMTGTVTTAPVMIAPAGAANIATIATSPTSNPGSNPGISPASNRANRVSAVRVTGTVMNPAPPPKARRRPRQTLAQRTMMKAPFPVSPVRFAQQRAVAAR